MVILVNPVAAPSSATSCAATMIRNSIGDHGGAAVACSEGWKASFGGDQSPSDVGGADGANGEPTMAKNSRSGTNSSKQGDKENKATYKSTKRPKEETGTEKWQRIQSEKEIKEKKAVVRMAKKMKREGKIKSIASYFK